MQEKRGELKIVNTMLLTHKKNLFEYCHNDTFIPQTDKAKKE